MLDLSAPSDPEYVNQWALPAISALEGWSLLPGTFSPSPSVPIAIVDTGVDATHSDLTGRVSALSATCLSGACNQGIPTDDDGHGTHVSGIAGAATDNANGVAGLSFASPLIVVRVFPADASQGADLSDVDENDPKSMARWAKKMGQQMGGDEMGEDFDQVVDEMGDGPAGGEDGDAGIDDDEL